MFRRRQISGAGFIINNKRGYPDEGLTKKRERRTSNIERPTSNNVFCQFKKDKATRGASDSTLRNSIRLPFDRLRPRVRRGELFDLEFVSEGLVTGCGSLVLKSTKRSVINIRRSMLDVRCSTFKALSPPGGFAVQSMLGDLSSKFDIKVFLDEASALTPEHLFHYRFNRLRRYAWP